MKSRVLLFATHIHSTNGYCLVGHALANELAKHEDIDLTYYGFQNFHKNPAHMSKRTLPNNVFIYDAFENENPKGLGFGFDQVTEFVTMSKPDVCIIYNDMVVVSTIMDKLKAVPNRNFKIVVYIDQVYLYQKKEFIKRLNEETDMVLAFTPYWQECIVKQGLTRPVDFIRHGFDPMVHYPVPKALARKFFGLKEEDFILLNLNRNQPRKRWDICMQAFAEIVSRHLEDPIKLLIATAVQGSWNLIEVYERELWKRGITLEDGMKHIILIDNPQQITDEEINILYNVADIGITTCDGEGFGLCSFQQAAVGVPQIVPAIGGFLDFFNKDNAITIEPKYSLYIDTSRDGVGGECQLCDWRDFVDAFELYYGDRDLITKHGNNARKLILQDYKWVDIGDKLYGLCKKVCGHEIVEKKKVKEDDDISLEDIARLIGDAETPKPDVPATPINTEPNTESNTEPNITTTERKKLKVVEVSDSDESDHEDIKKLAKPSRKDAVKDRLRKKLQQKKAKEKKKENPASNNLDIDSLLELKNKIDKLLAEKSKA